MAQSCVRCVSLCLVWEFSVQWTSKLELQNRVSYKVCADILGGRKGEREEKV